VLVASTAPASDSAARPAIPVLARANDSVLAAVLEAARRPAAGSAADLARPVIAWVAGAIRLRGGEGGFTVGRILARREATSSERARVLARLLQAEGLEAQPVWGLRWRGGRWHLSSWIEVAGQEPFLIDPELTQLPADAARVRLAAGGTPRLLSLLLLAGRLRLEPLAEVQ
jgi:hypothetical protein